MEYSKPKHVVKTLGESSHHHCREDVLQVIVRLTLLSRDMSYGVLRWLLAKHASHSPIYSYSITRISTRSYSSRS